MFLDMQLIEAQSGDFWGGSGPFASQVVQMLVIIHYQNMGSCVGKQSKKDLKTEVKAETKTTPVCDQHTKNNLKPIIKPNLPPQIEVPTSNPHLKDKIKPKENETVDLKVPKDTKTWAEFHWITEQKYLIPKEISNESSSFIRTRSFQEKYLWLKSNLDKIRIPFIDGCDELKVDRSNLLMSSNAQFDKINFHKEVKINFNDDDEAMDAGGLLRQWMSLCIKEVFCKDLGILSLCETKTTFYKFNYNQQIKELFEVAAKILGVVIGKAIFERIPLKCFLNYTILRQICSQPVQMNDINTYDQNFYQIWPIILENREDMKATSIGLDFTVSQEDEYRTMIVVPLKENGHKIYLNSSNREEYIELIMKHYCTARVLKMIQNLRLGIYKVIPHDLLSVFEPHQLDMIINGKSQIDILDMKKNTLYTDYSPTDQVILWFWEYVQSLDQEHLEHVLNFVTGNSRVPMQGFANLESNRGELQKFQIRSIPFDPIEPYPKSHTCFNRLELPVYPTKEDFDSNIVYISVQNNHFGLQ